MLNTPKSEYLRILVQLLLYSMGYTDITVPSGRPHDI
jgi:hypothetical protein